jgi:hypothetical protein
MIGVLFSEQAKPATVQPVAGFFHGSTGREKGTMRVNIVNLGVNDIRVVVDHDTVNDFTLKPGMDEEYVSEDEGVIELRELGSAEPAE